LIFWKLRPNRKPTFSGTARSSIRLEEIHIKEKQNENRNKGLNANTTLILKSEPGMDSELSVSKNSKTEVSKINSIDLHEKFMETLGNERLRYEFEFFLISELSLENLVLYDAVSDFLKKFEYLEHIQRCPNPNSPKK
jgi:hypothetical protein